VVHQGQKVKLEEREKNNVDREKGRGKEWKCRTSSAQLLLASLERDGIPKKIRKDLSPKNIGRERGSPDREGRELSWGSGEGQTEKA